MKLFFLLIMFSFNCFAMQSLPKKEWEIAKKVCQAYKSKRLYFNQALLNTDKFFFFNVEGVNCRSIPFDRNNTKALLVKDRHGTLTYEATDYSQLHYNIQTDNYGYLKKTCSDIFKGLPTEKILLRNDRVYTYEFLLSGKDAHYVVEKYKVTTRDWKFMRKEKITVSLSNDQFRGMLLSRQREIVCPDGKTSSYFNQDLVK